METAVGDDKVFSSPAMLPLPLSDVIRERNSAHVRKRGRPPLAEEVEHAYGDIGGITETLVA